VLTGLFTREERGEERLDHGAARHHAENE
jgi:hypothetical protein